MDDDLKEAIIVSLLGCGAFIFLTVGGAFLCAALSGGGN